MVSDDDDDDNDVRLSSVPSIIVATTCCDTPSSNDAFMPSHHHASLLLQERRSILHIHALRRDTMEEPRLEGKKTLYPGSLRKQGEYCLVHLEVAPEDVACTEENSSTVALFRWQVSRVDFRRMGHTEYTSIDVQ